jgi:hypothetical protein
MTPAPTRCSPLREALKNLHNEVAGTWSAFEPALRADISNTNYACVQLRLDEAKAALSESSEADPLEDLVSRFSTALLDKLKAARVKYGRDDKGWQEDCWREDCQRELLRHLAKGDPRDVAAYCAFLWHHGWPTAAPPTSDVPGEIEKILRDHFYTGEPGETQAIKAATLALSRPERQT